MFDSFDNMSSLSNKDISETTLNDCCDNKIILISKEYCKNNCEFFKTCYANNELCLKQLFNSILVKLTSKELQVIKLKFGYNQEKNSFEIAKELGVTVERVLQIETRAKRKILRSLKSKNFHHFIFDVLSLPDDNFYKTLFLSLNSKFEYEQFALKIGIDFSVIKADKHLLKTVIDIKNELDTPIHKISWLTDFITELREFEITTLNHLLHTSQKTLFFTIFNQNDFKYFNLLNTLSEKGYQLKDSLKDVIIFSMVRKIKQVFLNSIYKCLNDELIDLPLNTVLYLSKNGIYTVRTLLEHVQELKLDNTIKKQLIDYLRNKNLLYSYQDNIIYLTFSFLNPFLIWLVKELKNAGYSILDFICDLEKHPLPTFNDLVKILEEKYNKITPCYTLKILDLPLDEIDFSVRTYNCLKRAGIHNMETLIKTNEDNLFQIKNIDDSSIDEIIQKLSLYAFDIIKVIPPNNLNTKTHSNLIKTIEHKKVYDNSLFEEIHVENILAFMFSEGGAMGIPGEFKFYLQKNNSTIVYFGNRLDKCINPQTLEHKYQELKDLHEWKYIPLGMGNHCCIHPTIATRFEEKANGSNKHIYNIYHEIIIDILQTEVNK